MKTLTQSGLSTLQGARGVLKSGVPHDPQAARLLVLSHVALDWSHQVLEGHRVPSKLNVSDLPSRVWDIESREELMGRFGLFSLKCPWLPYNLNGSG